MIVYELKTRLVLAKCATVHKQGGGSKMYFEDSDKKVYSSDEVDRMSVLEIEECGLHVYEEEES